MTMESYRNVPVDPRSHCMICGSTSLEEVINLPNLPLTELYVETKADDGLALADQSLAFCPQCSHAQLMNVVDTKLQYGDTATYFFRTSQSATGRKTAQFFCEFLDSIASGQRFKTVVEVGCNDLYLLGLLQGRADRLIGIDPILKDIAPDTLDERIETIGEFFENVELDIIPDVVICKDVLEHVSNPRSFTEKIVAKASEKTLFVFQYPILETILSEVRFDQVFHQHLNYFSMQSTEYMLRELGCHIVGHTINHDHWGAGIIAFKKGPKPLEEKQEWETITSRKIVGRYDMFRNGMEQTARFLDLWSGEKVYGYGAGLMLAILSYHLGNDLSSLECVVDDDVKKNGLFYMNLPVQIRHSSEVHDLHEANVLLTAISSKINVRQILVKLLALSPHRIIYPLSTI